MITVSILMLVVWVLFLLALMCFFGSLIGGQPWPFIAMGLLLTGGLGWLVVMSMLGSLTLVLS